MRRGVVSCSVAAVLFGAATPAAARLGRHFDAFSLAGLLYVGAAVAMVPWASRQWPSRAAARTAAPQLVAAVVAGGLLGPVLLMAALGRAQASTVSLLLNLEVVFTVLLAGLVFREHLGSRVIAGAVAVAGAGVALGWSGTFDARVGAALAVGACACWALDNTVTARLTTFTPAQITLVKGSVAGTVNLLIGVRGADAFAWRMAAVALLVGALGYGVSITLWITGARELGAARGQVIFASAPFVGAVLAWLALGEPVKGVAVVAAALTLVGVALVVTSAHEHLHVHETLVHDHEHEHDDGHHLHVHDAAVGRHRHVHTHDRVEHAHGHMPDLHHRHAHH